VKIYLPFNKAKISDENVVAKFTDDSFLLTIQTEDKDFQFSATSLLKPIVIEKSYIKVKPQDEMVALYLKKEKEGFKWECLTKTEKQLKASKTKAFEDDKEADSKDPMGGLMNIMKKMYDSGDSEMKRTIAKAWTEGQEKSRGNPML
jgi:calcyclin binding protein